MNIADVPPEIRFRFTVDFTDSLLFQLRCGFYARSDHSHET